MQADYKPVMKVLSTDRICASVEEIILLTRSNDGNYGLTERELDFNGLISSYTNKSGSLVDTIKKRFRRLYSFTIMPISYGQFVQYMTSLNGSKPDFISDLELFNGSRKQYFNSKEEVKTQWGSSGQTYDMDKDGGSLNSYFKKVKADFEAFKKKDAIDKSVADRNKGLIEEVEVLYKRYKSMCKLQTRLSKMYGDFGGNGLYVHKPLFINPVTLYECSVVEANYPCKEKASSESDALNKNKQLLHQAIHSVVSGLAMNLISGIDYVASNSPITSKVLLKDVETTIVVPKNATSMASNIEQITGVKFDGEDIRSSAINSCWLFCMFFLDRTSGNWHSEYITRDYWKGVLGCFRRIY